jgi:hypothetical protein
MFGLRLITKRELSLLNWQISELREEKKQLYKQVDYERRRAEAAINALLIKTNKIALTPDPLTDLPDEEQEAIQANMLDIFGDNEEAEIIERLQHDHK